MGRISRIIHRVETEYHFASPVSAQSQGTDGHTQNQVSGCVPV